QGDTLGVEDGTITRVRVNGADLGGVWGSMGRDIEIDRCYLKDCLDVGIDAEFCEDITATNSTIIDAGNGGLAAFFGTKRFKTSKNTIRRKSLAAGAGLGYGFWITTSNGNKNEGIISEGDTFIHEDSTVIYADSNSMNSIKIIDPTIQTQSGGSMRITAGNGKVEWYGGSINHQAINRSMSLEGCTEAIIKPDLIKTVTDTGNGSSFGDAAILVYETSQGAPTRKNLIAPKRVEGFTVAVNDVATVLGVSQNTIEGVKTNGLIKWSGSVGNYRDNFRLDDPTLINQPVPVVPDAELQQDVKKYELLKRINQNQARINKKLLVNAAADYNGNPAFGAEIFGNIDLGYIRQMFLSIQGSGMDYVLGGSGGPGGDSLSTGDRFIRGFTLEHLFSRLGAAGYTFFQAGAADFNTIVSKMGSYTYTIDKGNAPNPNAPTSGTRHIGYQIVEATFCVQFARDYEDLAIEYSRKGIFANSAWSFTAWERTSGGAQTDPEPQSYTLAQLNTMRAAGELEYPSTYYLSDPEYTVNGQKSYVIALGPSSFGDAIVPLTLPAIRVQAIMRVIEVNAMARVSALNWKREDRYLFDGTQNPYLKVKANDQGNQTGGSTIE
ncbi:MAG: right-handed parallel beta-helix repeat-containing protein, partial [Mucilaginibacter polytrichastri]|nr:right-handed parallel beta-helix repeat-containing protein [Mucilaginibacter polytrichastri]